MLALLMASGVDMAEKTILLLIFIPAHTLSFKQQSLRWPPPLGRRYHL